MEITLITCFSHGMDTISLYLQGSQYLVANGSQQSVLNSAHWCTLSHICNSCSWLKQISQPQTVLNLILFLTVIMCCLGDAGAKREHRK